MREHRWASLPLRGFDEIHSISQKLSDQGLKPIPAQRDGICYIEEMEVAQLEDLNRLAPWNTEDITIVHRLDNWKDDLYLLTARHHSIFQQFATVHTYCSVSHPWHLPGHQVTLAPEARLWVGFRHSHSFIRVRLQTANVVCPGETWADHQRPIWLEERKQAFSYVIDLLDLPIQIQMDGDIVGLRTPQEHAPFFCSWADAFGPCQFELNAQDHFEFLIPASRLAQTHHNDGAHVRIYLTGFSQEQLRPFEEIALPFTRLCRCALHCALDELPELLPLLGAGGRVYMTLCEFQTQTLLPLGLDASAVIGVIGSNNQFALEFRCNLMPLPQQDMEAWLAHVLGQPMTYAPLPAFP